MNTLNSLPTGSEFKVDPRMVSDLVHEALRSLWDLMEFYIWYPTMDTAKTIKEQDGSFLGGKITAAIHIRNLTKDVKSAIKAQLDYWQDRKISEPYVMNDNVISWTYKGIPVELKILKRRYNFFNNPNPVSYNYDDYKLANPFDRYWKARFIVR